MTKNPALTGGCQCGALRYEILSEPVDLYICHCRECQKQSSSAFGISVRVKSGDLRVVTGTPSVWSRAATRSGTLACAFCPACGSRVWHGDPNRCEVVSIKGGSLDSPPDLSGAKHIWVSRKLRGILIPPDAQTWEQEPLEP